MRFPLIKLAKKLKVELFKNLLEAEKFPLIKLAKKLKEDFATPISLGDHAIRSLNGFPLIKLAKKLKDIALGIGGYSRDKFPLIKLAKKLKDVSRLECSLFQLFPLIKLAKKLKG